MARIRSKTITGENQFSDGIALKKGGVLTLSGDWVGTVSLQRQNPVAGWVDVTSNSGTPVTFTKNGTPGLDPYEFSGIYRFGIKTGNYVSGTLIGSIEGR